ncbi:MAG: DUF5685 family protein [Saccharofermentanales bacterium]|jgi:hypothetical protein|nr:DUF5685 family protein [Bacillota bacterium]NLB08099.1 hypothetical protein [Clostridiales bacterium]
MFGYIRPDKPELLMREFARFRACYCGICKTISENHGQIPRLAVSYDLTFLALLLLALSAKDAIVVQDTCVLNPFKKKPILRDHVALNFSADMAVLLTWLKAQDDAVDEKKIRGRLLSCGFASAGKRILSVYPELGEAISTGIKELAADETGPPDPAVAEKFGSILAKIFAEGAKQVLPALPDEIVQALTIGGARLGCWAYLIDAIDDLDKDLHNNEWNPFAGLAVEAARVQADSMLIVEEVELDRIFALLPYERDGTIIYNVIVKGLPAVRQTVMRGEKLLKL